MLNPRTYAKGMLAATIAFLGLSYCSPPAPASDAISSETLIFFGTNSPSTWIDNKSSSAAVFCAASAVYESISAGLLSPELAMPPEDETAICSAEIVNRFAMDPPPEAEPPDIPEMDAFVVPSVVIVTLPAVP